jgi:hypothetical protein
MGLPTQTPDTLAAITPGGQSLVGDLVANDADVQLNP